MQITLDLLKVRDEIKVLSEIAMAPVYTTGQNSQLRKENNIYLFYYSTIIVLNYLVIAFCLNYYLGNGNMKKESIVCITQERNC